MNNLFLKKKFKFYYLKTKKIQESIGGIREIITFEKENYFSDIYDKYINKLIKVFYRYHFLSLEVPQPNGLHGQCARPS